MEKLKEHTLEFKSTIIQAGGMDQSFLRFIWEHSRFDHRNLCTQNGERIELIHPGYVNKVEGPDFINATIQIGDNLWRGSVVIHMDGDDWYKKHQDSDPNYANVILNVCFRNIQTISNAGGYQIPAVELNGKMPEGMLSYYSELQRSGSLLSCRDRLAKIDSSNFGYISEQLNMERLEERAVLINDLLIDHNGDWDTTFFKLLVMNFAGSSGSPTFSQLAEILDYDLIFEHRASISTVEAILYGQSGLLNDAFSDDYPKILQSTFNDILQLNHLPQLDDEEWKYEVITEYSLTHIRLSQLASLICQNDSVFNHMLDHDRPFEEISELDHASYWNDHTTFDHPKSGELRSSNNGFAEFIMINVITPAIYAYGKALEVADVCIHALDLLKGMNAEINRKTMLFSNIGLNCENAAHSQAVSHLFNSYCISKKCLKCPVGCQLLGKNSTAELSVRNINVLDYIYN